MLAGDMICPKCGGEMEPKMKAPARVTLERDGSTSKTQQGSQELWAQCADCKHEEKVQQ